jgi:hypothetical protein
MSSSSSSSLSSLFFSHYPSLAFSRRSVCIYVYTEHADRCVVYIWDLQDISNIIIIYIRRPPYIHTQKLISHTYCRAGWISFCFLKNEKMK